MLQLNIASPQPVKTEGSFEPGQTPAADFFGEKKAGGKLEQGAEGFAKTLEKVQSSGELGALRDRPSRGAEPSGSKAEEKAQAKQDFKRPLLPFDQGATRVRTFHIRLSDKAMSYLDEQINEWLDNSPDVAVKFTNTTVGMVEGKKIEPHLIITVWY